MTMFDALSNRPVFEFGSIGGSLVEYVLRTPWFVAALTRETAKGRTFWSFTLRDRKSERDFKRASKAKGAA